MPAEYPVVNDAYIVQDTIQSQQQTKVCTVCHIALLDPLIPLGDPQAGVCPLCREKQIPAILQPQQQRTLPSARRQQESISAESTHPPYHASIYTKRHHSPQTRYAPPRITHTHSSDTNPSHRVQQQLKQIPSTSLNPLIDITFLRHRPVMHQCLYAGAVFQGTQKSGRNSYDVHVTIVDVNFAASTLCGYLRIRGLTDDWPELTTYFDAEIIGSRYGFLTQSWGATPREDVVHWSRFPAFKNVRHEAKGPHLTIDDRERGCVFMRWKERFLVPDHRVHDINGASFAGFYYVCVDLNPPAHPTRLESQSVHLTPDFEEDELDDLCPPYPLSHQKLESRPSPCRDSSIRPRAHPSSVLSPQVATMCGFYYHQNSEPYQQLSLAHVLEETSSSFEFR